MLKLTYEIKDQNTVITDGYIYFNDDNYGMFKEQFDNIIAEIFDDLREYFAEYDED